MIVTETLPWLLSALFAFAAACLWRKTRLLKTRLNQPENVRKEFAANVSHELRTPVTSIKGFVETLLEGAAKSPAELDRFLRIILKQTNRLNAIIEDLLTLSALEQPGEDRQMELKAESLRSIVKDACDLSNAAAAQKNIRLNLDADDDIEGTVNRHLLEQAVFNLIDNAIKYSSEHTQIFIRLRRSDHSAVISVQDFGAGIAEEHQTRVFERFYTVDKARSRKLGGTGLGLAIVKHVALAHKGSVTLESKAGKGSTFSIFLPLRPMNGFEERKVSRQSAVR